MKKANLNLLVSILLIISSCTSQNKKEYQLNGFVKDVPNNTWVYLALENGNIDSTQVRDEKFQFRGEIIHPMLYDLFIKETNDYTSLWLSEGKNIFESAKGDFDNAKTTGSRVHIEYDNFSGTQKILSDKQRNFLKIQLDKNLNDSIREKARNERDSLYRITKKNELDFITNNPNSYVSAYLLDFYTTTYGKEKTNKLFNNFSEELKISSYGKSIERYLELSKKLKIGDKYIDFSMKDINGKLIQVSDFEGKLILLDFWASWCGPCKEEFPALRNAYSAYKNQGFEIIGISEDQDYEDWIKSINSNNLEWTNVWDKFGNRADPYFIYGINGIPDNFLIDKNGIIIGRNLRGEDLYKKLAELMSESSTTHD